LSIGEIFQMEQNAGVKAGPVDNPATYIEDDIPVGSETFGQWSWIRRFDSAVSGPTLPMTHFTIMSPQRMGIWRLWFLRVANHSSSTSISARPTEEILLQFYTDQGNGEHRAFWGTNKIQTGAHLAAPHCFDLAPFPTQGQWIRLKIPASQLGLENVQLKDCFRLDGSYVVG